MANIKPFHCTGNPYTPTSLKMEDQCCFPICFGKWAFIFFLHLSPTDVCREADGKLLSRRSYFCGSVLLWHHERVPVCHLKVSLKRLASWVKNVLQKNLSKQQICRGKPQQNVDVLRWILFVLRRVFYVASREGQLPEVLSMIHIRRHTPIPAVIVLVSLENTGVSQWSSVMILGLSWYHISWSITIPSSVTIR